MTNAIELHTNQNLHPQHAFLVSTKSSADLERSRVQMTSDPKRGAFRYRARVMYDGLQYFGMQYQPRGPSVAGTLQHTIARRCQQNVAIVAASRTDTGVHARGQAVHFDLDTEYDSRELEYSINRMLPDDIRVMEVERASEISPQGRPWHATYWATGKQYSYRFYYGPAMDPQQRFYRHRCATSRGLDLYRMDEAARMFEGEHDFALFANTPRGSSPAYSETAKKTVRLVRSVRVVDEGDGYARADFLLKGALYKMVRFTSLTQSSQPSSGGDGQMLWSSEYARNQVE